MNDATRRFADNVRARRKVLKLTQEAAALSVQMDMSYWSRIERGKVDPGLRTVARIAKALETTPAALMADVDAGPADARTARIDALPSRPSTAAAPATRRDPLPSSSRDPCPSLSTRLAYGSAVVYFPTNFFSACAPAHMTPPRIALPPINLIAVVVSPSTSPVPPFVPPLT